MKNKHTETLIIGGGPAGYTAAIYAARAGLKPLQILGLEPGGQLMITTDVENYPGFAEMIQGPWLMDHMQKQAENVGTEMLHDLVVDVDFTKTPFEAKTDGGLHITADTIIIATGAKAMWLGLESEKKFQGYGVSACATCDGFFFRKKDVIVIGGGNTAVEEAIYMTNHANHVTLVHRRDFLRSEKILQDRLFANPKIDVLWNHTLEEVIGDTGPLKVTAAKLKNQKTGETITKDIDGIFVAIGHAPETSLFKGKLAMDDHAYLTVTPGSTKTNVPGVFAAGDVQDKIYRQAVTAAGQGCMAALDAQKYLQGSR